MLFVQHLAERGLRSHLGLSDITAMLKESRCSGDITGARSSGRPVAPCVFRSLASRKRWWSDPNLQSFSLARGEEEALSGVSCPVRTGEKWERAAGKHHAWALALGRPAATQTSPSRFGRKVPLTSNKISVQEAVSWYTATAVSACLVNCFGIAWIQKAWREKFFYYIIF